MGYLFDIVIAAILGLTIWFGFKKGFIKTVLSALSFFIALVLAFSFQPKLSDKINEMPIVDSVRETIREEFIKLAPTDKNEQGFDSEKLISEKPEGFMTILNIAGIEENDIKTKFEGWKKQGTEKAADALVSYIAEPIIKGLVSVVSFAIIFFVSLLLLRLLVLLLDNVFRLPVLKQANQVLGVALGVFLGLFRAYLFGAAVTLLLPIIQSKNTSFILGDSFIFRFFYGDANILIGFFK